VFNALQASFIPVGFAATVAILAVERAKSTDTEKLIAATKGLESGPAKGETIFRKADLQAHRAAKSGSVVPDSARRKAAFLMRHCLSPDRTQPAARLRRAAVP
jgi:branched-chain amino acid transport system substrate-binding protein